MTSNVIALVSSVLTALMSFLAVLFYMNYKKGRQDVILKLKAEQDRISDEIQEAANELLKRKNKYDDLFSGLSDSDISELRKSGTVSLKEMEEALLRNRLRKSEEKLN